MSQQPPLSRVLESAARLQELVPDAVLVGGAAAVSDLAERYAEIVEAVEATDGWATSVRASSPPLTLLGSLDGVEAGLRQLRRRRPLEVTVVDVRGHALQVPTLDECLRVKAYLVVQRNQVRDHLDVVALADRMGQAEAVSVLSRIDEYYADRSGEADSVLTVLVQRLSQPEPRDTRVTRQLASYKGLVARWQDWDAVVSACNGLADLILERLEEGS